MKISISSVVLVQEKCFDPIFLSHFLNKKIHFLVKSLSPPKGGRWVKNWEHHLWLISANVCKYVGNYFGLFPTHSLTNFSSKTLHSKSPNKENKTSERQLLSQAHK